MPGRRTLRVGKSRASVEGFGSVLMPSLLLKKAEAHACSPKAPMLEFAALVAPDLGEPLGAAAAPFVVLVTHRILLW